MQMIDLEELLWALGRTSAQAGVLVVLVLAVQWLFRKQLTPRWRCALWWLVVVRLCLPWSLNSVVSIFNLVPSFSAETDIEIVTPVLKQPTPSAVPANEASTFGAPVNKPMTQNVERHSQDSFKPMTPATQPVQSIPGGSHAALATTMPRALPPFSWPLVFLVVWLGGAVGMLSVIVVASVRLTRRFAQATRVTDSLVLAHLRECCQQMGVAARLAVAESPAVASPVLHGFMRPRLLLPAGFTAAFPVKDMRYVFLHELAHVKRRDILLGWTMALLQMIHWFNPLVWVGFARWRIDRELACDALALEVAGADRNLEYGRTILRLLEGLSSRLRAPGLVGILEDKRQLKQRLGMIADFRPRPRWGLLSLLLVAGLGLACLTDAQVSKTQPSKAAGKTIAPASLGEKTNAVREVRLGADPPLIIGGTNAARSLVVTVLDKLSGKPVAGAEMIDVIAETSLVFERQKEPEPTRLTDERGQFAFQIPLSPFENRNERPSQIHFTVRHPNYALRSAKWWSSISHDTAGHSTADVDILQKLPKKITIRLDQGIVIGGTVLDERGKRLTGVRVLVFNQFAHPQGQMPDYPIVEFSDKTKPAAITDSQGRWTLAHFPSDLEVVEITLVRPDGSSENFATAKGLPRRSMTFVPFVELADQAAVFKLNPGVTVRGRVVDEKGRPLSNVQVKDGYTPSGYYRGSEFITGRNGRFEFYHRMPRQWIYTASAEGRATVSMVAQVNQGMTEIRMVMPPAKPLRIRVVSENNEPLTGIKVSADRYINKGQILEWEGQTDAEGRVVWTNAPAVQVLIEAVGARGRRQFTVMAGDQERTLTLRDGPNQGITVRVRAVDSQTRLPVRVNTVLYEPFSASPIGLTAPGTNEFSVEIPADIIRKWFPFGSLLVKAKDYEQFRMGYIDQYIDGQELDVAMAPGMTVNGIVKLPDGRPAEGAWLYARPDPEAGSLFDNGVGALHNRQWWSAQVNSDGTFQLADLASNAPVVFKHFRGFLETTVADLKGMREVRLQPWGRIEGQLTVAGQSKSGTEVHLASLSMNQPFHLSWLSVPTSSDGRFAFADVPPGEYLITDDNRNHLGRSIPTRQVPVVVKPGETVKVDYRFNGRAVVGRLKTNPENVAVDWLHDIHLLVLKQPSLPTVNYEDFASKTAYNEARSYDSPERLQQIREARSYPLVCTRDGSFQIDDVPPGTYELRIKVTKPEAPDRYQSDILALFTTKTRSLVRDVIVPKGNTPFDLGAIVVPMRRWDTPP